MIENMVFEVGEDPCPTVNWGEGVTDSEAKESIEKLLGFISACGYSVEFERGCHSCINHENRTIYVNSAYGFKRMYYILLHETAHMVMLLRHTLPNSDTSPYIFLYSGYANKKMAQQPMKTNRFLVAQVHEELDAWRKGIDIAHALQMPLDMYAYTQLAYQAAGTYIKAAARYCRDFV